MSSLDGSALVILVHLWKGVTVIIEVGRNCAPPDWEMLLEGSTHVRAVWSWLSNDVVEGRAWSFPRRSLDT